MLIARRSKAQETGDQVPAEQNNPPGQSYRDMTVANIRDEAGVDHVDVVFLESARFYRLDRDLAKFEKALQTLRQALNEKRTVRVELESPHSDIIRDVREK